MLILEVGLRPAGQALKDRPKGGAAFSELEGVVARSGLRVGSLDQLEAGEQFQAGREDIGGDVFWGSQEV